MPRIRKVQSLDKDLLNTLSYTWHTDLDGEYFCFNEFVEISKTEKEAYYKAGEALYKMYEEAAEYVVQNSAFDELDIAENMIELIKTYYRIKFWITKLILKTLIKLNKIYCHLNNRISFFEYF